MVNKKMDVTLTCEGECIEPIETCIIEICANFSPANDDDIYQVVLPGGETVKIQGGFVTLPGGAQIPYDGIKFCADIELPVGTTETAVIAFKGAGEVFTTASYPDGTDCVIFKAGQGTTQVSKLKKEVTLSCEPGC